MISSNGPLGVHHWATRLADKIMLVSNDAPQPIRDQANAFKAHILRLAEVYMKEAIKSDRSYLAHKLDTVEISGGDLIRSERIP